MKQIYGFKHKSTLKIMFSYRTNQGNEKKAFFTRMPDAEMVLKRYIKNVSEWEIVVIAEAHQD